jgi:DNA repair protein RadC
MKITATITIHDADTTVPACRTGGHIDADKLGAMLTREYARALTNAPGVTEATPGAETRTKPARPLIDTPEKAAEQFNFIRDKKQEHFAMLTLDGARRLIAARVVTIGTLTASIVHPREVFAPAIEDRAASIIIAHNHPSGSLEISRSDREVTGRIREAGELLGIRMDDHIIVTENDFVCAA